MAEEMRSMVRVGKYYKLILGADTESEREVGGVHCAALEFPAVVLHCQKVFCKINEPIP